MQHILRIFWCNWTWQLEKKIILRVKETIEKFAITKKIFLFIIENFTGYGKERLLEERNKRIRPALDDKIIWLEYIDNTACSKALRYRAWPYRQLAVENMRFLWKTSAATIRVNFCIPGKIILRSTPAFLDDLCLSYWCTHFICRK